MSFDPEERLLARRLLIDDENPLIIYALVNKYVYRTKNGGTTWEIIFDDLTIPDYWDKNKYLHHIEFKPNDHNTLYISSVSIKTATNPTHEYSAEIWKTHNAKATNVVWQGIETGLPEYCERYGLETDPQNPNLLYISYTMPGSSSGRRSFYLKTATYPNYQVQNKYESLNYSNNYYNPFSGLGYFMFDMELSPSNPDIMFFGGFNLEIVNLSTNQLVDFYNVSSSTHPSFHVDQRVFKTAVSGGKTYLFCGNDGGVSRYNYTDDIMESLNGEGLDNLQYYGIGNSELMPEFYIGGTQDNGEIGNGPGYWIRYNLGDSYENIIDPVEPNIVYATMNGGSRSIYKSLNSGQNFSAISNGLSQPISNGYGLNDRPFIMSPSDRNTLYVGYHEVYKTTNAGANWQQFTFFHDGGYDINNEISAIGTTVKDEDVMYVAYNNATWKEPGISSRLFRTVNGGSTWSDLSNTSIIGQAIRSRGITDINISTLNKNEIYLSLGNFGEDQYGNTVYSVLKSVNGGNTWVDISYNLPNLPVNCLAGMDFGGKYYLFAGTDIGLLYYNKANNIWENISSNLPMTIIKDVEINRTSFEFRLATFGRGIWKAKIPCLFDIEDVTISANELVVWNEEHVVSGILKLEPNSKLTIKESVLFGSTAKIIVKPGAKLIVDGAKLSNACSEAWLGIEVWGNSNAHQYPDANGNYQQGYVEIKNGAVIENAWEAIQPWRPDGWTEIGGIIVAKGATFRNNRRAVQFMSYQNFDPVSGNPRPNQSYFSNCKFETTDEYEGLFGVSPFHAFVSMWQVDGVKFLGCDFIDGRSDFQHQAPNQGVGIFTIDANFYVLPRCVDAIINCWNCTQVDLDLSSFTGLNIGINSSQANT